MKKLKKKPKNGSIIHLKNCFYIFLEEEERKMYDDYKNHLSSQLNQTVYNHVKTLEENNSEIIALQKLKINKRPDQEYFDMLSMKKTIKDLDLEEKRILLRIHLKAKNKIPLLTAEEREQIQAAQEAEREKTMKLEQKIKEEQKQNKGRKVKKTKEEIAEELAKLKEEEAKREFISGVDEKSLYDAINLIKSCLEQLAKLVIVLVSFGEPNGKPNPSTSLKYFWEYARDSLDQICNFEDTCTIPDLPEKLEADVYPNNSALILENIFFHPEEAGYIYDEHQELQKLDHYQIQEFANLLSTYSPVYVIEDLYNIYRDYASLSRIRTEFTVFGPTLSTDLTLVAQAFLHCAYQPKKSSRKTKIIEDSTVTKRKTIAVIGGEFSADLILAMNTILAYYDEIYIMGRAGVLFLMHRLGFKQFADFKLDSYQHQLIENILIAANELGKIVHIPDKLIVAPEPEEKEDPQWITGIFNTRFAWPDLSEQTRKGSLADKTPTASEDTQKKLETSKKTSEPGTARNQKTTNQKEKETVPEATVEDNAGPVVKPLGTGFIVVGYDQAFVQQIEEQVYNARNILWIGSLEPILHPGLNATNQSLALTIYNVKEERRPPTLQNALPADWLISCVGADLVEAMNHFDIIFDAPPATQSRKDEAMSEIDKSRSVHDEMSMSRAEVESVSRGTKVEKRNNVGLVADIYSGNAGFVFNLIAGRELEGKQFF